MVQRPEMSKVTRAKLIDAARDLLSTQPYETTTVLDIASAAGVTKGAMYHHYPDKQAVLLAVQHADLDQAIEQSEAIVSRHLTAPDELRALVHLHLRLVAEDGMRLSSGVHEARRAQPESWAEVKKKRDHLESFIVDVINRGTADGDFRALGDSRQFAFAILGMCYHSHIWYRSGGAWTLEEIAAGFARFALSGLEYASTDAST
jgi:AcrR family transcriptional regulator